MKTELERFLTELRTYVGAAVQGGMVVFVAQGSPLQWIPSMYSASVLQEAIDSGEIERRTLTVNTAYQSSQSIDIIAAKKDQ